MDMSLEQSMRTIIPWINSLPPQDCALFTMDSNMKDGRVIAGIVESITGHPVPDFNKRAKTVEQREVNFQAIIKQVISDCPDYSPKTAPSFITDTNTSRRMAEVFSLFLFMLFFIYLFFYFL